MRNTIIFLGVLVALALTLMAPSFALAFNPFCQTDSSGNCVSGPCKDNPQAPTCQQAQSEGGSGNRVNGTNSVINAVANVIALITGVAAVIIIIISGFTFVTSGGNQESLTSSRRRLVAAIAGLVIVALAWAFIRFITDKLIQ